MKSKLGLLFIFLLVLNLSSNAQFYFIEDNLEQVEVQFLRKKIEVKEGESFFNVLKIKNPSNRRLSFETNFSYPAEWSFIGDKNQNIILEPSDSILIPYRAAPAVNAKGEIGYAFVASLSDNKGNTFKTEYSFVNIPKISNLKFKPVNRTIYFDNNKRTSNIDLRFSNSGNTDEYIIINFDLSLTLETEGSKDGQFIDELTLKPKTDTIVTYPLKLITNKFSTDNKSHRIKVQVNTKDTSYHSSIWAKELDNNYSNFIPYNYKMLTLEATAQNILADKKANMNYHIFGYFLPKGNSVFYYDYQTFGVTKTSEDYWYSSRMRFKYSDKWVNIWLGDINEIMGHNLYGRGGLAEVNVSKNSRIKIASSKSINSEILKAATSFQQKLKNNNRVEVGGSYEESGLKNVNSVIGFSNIGINLKDYGKLILNGAVSNAMFQNSDKQQLSYSGSLRYNYFSKKITINFHTILTPKEYYGNLPGRNQLRSMFRYSFSNRKSIVNDLYFIRNNIPLYIEDYVTSSGISGTLRNRLTYNINVTPTVRLSGGPVYEAKEGSNFYGSGNSYLKTQSAFGYFSVKKRNRLTNSTLTGSFTGGYNFADKVYIDNPNSKKRTKNWFSGVLALSYRSKFWGLSANYYEGPYSINQQFYAYYRSQRDKYVMIMPFLDIFIIPKYLRLSVRPNLTYTVLTKTTRANINSELIAYPGKEWEFILTNAYNYTASKELLDNEMTKTTYAASYFELRVRKSFNFNQPKYQYHNLKYYFFKDLNGNNVKDEDEPGVKNVLLTIEKDDEYDLDNNENITGGYFMSVDLLSDMNGYVRYDNIPNGFYKISYKPIGKMEGAYTSENSVERIHVSKDEVFYIPFHENNKIFGKVKLNRSKLSNLGKIDPSNIKVTAEDSKGKKISTLTDANGNFVLFVPNVDKYKVRVNNIFYENFELEQNDYQVQLNGYRQFEVNFIFNEKRRKIRFATSYEYGASTDGPGVEIIRRTNLSGTIKDATTLKPLVANVRVVDSKGNEVTNGRSNLRNGMFSLSFVAGNDYVIEVTADDYWFTAEKFYDQQLVTFKNINKEILLKAITVGQLIPMKTLNFEPESYEIPATSFPELERLLKVLRKNPTVKISVHGHADDLEIQGSEIDLALERAKIIAKYLIANGYNRVKYIGHANTKPIADNDTEDGRMLNRRVEIVVTGK